MLHGGVAPETRNNVVRRFAPLASGAQSVVGTNREIAVLISTDVLSEGQNLQDANCVVNYDLHWNPTKMVQRVGRIDRLGSPHSEIAVHNFFPDEGLFNHSLRTAVIDRRGRITASIEGNQYTPEQLGDLVRAQLMN